ncbi:MAG: hypothetical protein ACE5R6_04595 [Candidatus Heimdallarchaeota archaeon]
MIDLTDNFYDCSRGWVSKIFETALKKLVTVALEKAIGRGGKDCQFIIYT